jgi:small membrane protein
MTAIQIVLITGVLFILVYFLQRIQKAVFSVVFMTLLSGLAVFFILQPELTNKIARYIGVGRISFYGCMQGCENWKSG